MSLELFACPRIRSLKLSREACARRHVIERAGREGYVGATPTECKRCEIGKAHAKGQKPDVQLVTIAHTVSPKPKRRPHRSKYERAVELTAAEKAVM